MIENTTERDPLLHLVGSLSDGYIEGMEAAGQRQVVAATDLMPADGPWQQLTALGFGEPEPTDDPLFVRTTLPTGWSKVGSDHAMHSTVVDERGVERIGVFYKAAFYDRRASFHLIAAGHSLATKAIYGDQPAALPEQWAVLTEEERGDFVFSLNYYLEDAERFPDIYGDRVEWVQALKAQADR